jgi:hypothetical protein
MRRTLVTVVAASSLVGAGPLAAQMSGPAPAVKPSVFTLTPHIGMTAYGDMGEISFSDDGSISGFPASGSLSAKLDTQLSLGLSGEYQPLASAWGLFGDFTRSSGDATFKATFCDPDFGCDSGKLSAEGSQWRATAGVTRRFAFGAGSVAKLSLGALYAKTHVEAGDAEAGVPDIDASSPGGTIGLSLDFPLSGRVGIRLESRDALMRVSSDSFAGALTDVPPGSGIVIGKDDVWMNAFTFGGGLVLHW